MRYWDDWLRLESSLIKDFQTKLERELVAYSAQPSVWCPDLAGGKLIENEPCACPDCAAKLEKASHAGVVPYVDSDMFLLEFSFMVPFFACGKVIIRPDPKVSWMLAHTRLTVPTNIVNPPFNCIYVDLTEADMRLRSIIDGELVLGAFLLRAPDWVIKDGEVFRGVDDTLKVSIVKKPKASGFLPGIFHTPSIVKQEREFEELVESISDPEHIGRNMTAQKADQVKPIVRLCLGLCLYMSHPELCKNVIPNMHPKRESCLRDLKKGEVTGQVRAMIRSNTSVIKVTGLKNSGGVGAATDATRIPHWRRGHNHTYWVGPGRKIKKELWVAAVLVNAELLAAGQTVEPKTYEVL